MMLWSLETISPVKGQHRYNHMDRKQDIQADHGQIQFDMLIKGYFPLSKASRPQQEAKTISII